MQYKSLVENTLCTKIITLRSDSGGEYMSTMFSTFLAQHGIQHLLSCPHTPEQNGCADRKHRHLVETARTLFAASKVPHFYWVDVFAVAIYLINRLPTLSWPSPCESLFKKLPCYSTLRVFGCLCFPWLKPYTSSKLDAKSKPCVFLGYSLNHKGYKCLDSVTGRLYISQHVLFDESTFPYYDLSASSTSSPLTPTSPSSAFPSSLTFTSLTPTSPSSHFSGTSSSPHPTAPPPPPHSSINNHPMQTRSKSGIYKPKAFTATNHPLLSHLSLDYIPTTYLQASKHPHWCQAMQEEFNALLHTQTWSLVPYHSL
ncbi:hypothetical protein ACFX2H_012130 [Malus domestica]